MNLALTVLEITAPVALIAGFGFGWVRLGFEYRIQFVTRLAMSVAMPCLVFTSLMQADIAPQTVSVMALAALAAYVLLALAAFAVVRLAGLERRSFLAPMIFGNTGNLGLPLAYFAFGDQGLALALAVFAVSAVLGFTFGLWLVSGGGNPRNVLREPLVWASILGGIFLWHGWQTPPVLTRALALLGQMAIPLMLLTLGVAVGRLVPGRLGRAAILSVARTCLGVAAAVSVALAAGLGQVAFGVLVLQFSTPVAVTSYLLAEKYGADSQAVAGMVVVSTLLSVASLPLVLAFVI